MKCTCLTNIICMIILGTTAGGAVSGLGKTIVYPGDELKPARPNGDGGSYWPNSLFPEGSASGNEVFINDGGDAITFVFGNDISIRKNVMNNSVTISGGTIRVGGVNGGYSENFSVMGNSVTVSGGEITETGVSGGYSATSVATGNSVTVSGGLIGGHAIGGSTNTGFAANNSITVSGGVIKGYVQGGFSSSGLVTGNSVTISGGKIENLVLGGFSLAGDVTGNSVLPSNSPKTPSFTEVTPMTNSGSSPATPSFWTTSPATSATSATSSVLSSSFPLSRIPVMTLPSSSFMGMKLPSRALLFPSPLAIGATLLRDNHSLSSVPTTALISTPTALRWKTPPFPA